MSKERRFFKPGVEQIKLDANDYTIVRVWTSKFNKEVPGRGVGHVSLETRDCYASLWPQEGFEKGGPGIFKGIAHEYQLSYQDDLDLEHRGPEATIVFYSLDTRAIAQQFQVACDNPDREGWRLFGSNLLSPKVDSPHSCCSFVGNLLDAGGIAKILPAIYRAKGSYSIIISPDNILPLLQAAKKRELKKHPYIAHFTDPCESSVVAQGDSLSSEDDEKSTESLEQ